MSIKEALLPVLAFMGSAAISVVVMGIDTPKPADTSGTPASSADNTLLIVHKSDGTFTVQKKPAAAKSEDARRNGLVIPPQVVVPELRATEKD